MSEESGPRCIQRYRRVVVRVGARISTIDPETDPDTGAPYFRTSEETCANVSRGGAYLEASETVAPGRRLLVELDLPSGEPVQTVARVAWTRAQVRTQDGVARAGIGLEFVGADSEELERLDAFIDEAAPADVGSAPARA